MLGRVSRSGLLAMAACFALCMQSVGAMSDDLETKAKAEKSLVWYTSDSVQSAEAMAKRFQQKYGISVQINRKTTLPLVEQFVAESARGRSPADVFTVIGMGPMASGIAEKKLLASYVPRGAEKLPAQYRVGDTAFAYILSPMGVAYNTNLVKPEEVALLKSYKGWLDPRFKGRMAITAPIGGTTGGNMLLLQEKYGVGFIEALIKDQKAVVYQTVATTGDAVISGEQAIGLNLTPGVALQAAAGAPVRYVSQDDWTFVVPAVAGVSANASHPNAARLFMNFLFTEEAQKLHADTSYWIPILPGVKPSYPKAEWLELPKNPVTTEDPIKFDRDINANIGNWRKILGW
jgi:iron(III) transport system substrate-binding protein